MDRSDGTAGDGMGGTTTMETDPQGPALSSRLRLAILRTSRRLRQEAVGQITASQLSALSTIALSNGASLGELAASERIAPPSMTRIVARLEEQELVQRRNDEADRRVSRLEITPAGRALLDEIRSRRDAYLADRLADLTPEELAVLSQALPIFERLIADG